MIIMTKKVFIEGMTCGHCVHHVESALKEVAGVITVNVNLKGKFAVIESTGPVDDDAIKAAVDEAGYKVADIG